MNTKSTSASVPPATARTDNYDGGGNGEFAAILIGLDPKKKLVVILRHLSHIWTYIGVVMVVGDVIVAKLPIVVLLYAKVTPPITKVVSE